MVSALKNVWECQAHRAEKHKNNVAIKALDKYKHKHEYQRETKVAITCRSEGLETA